MKILTRKRERELETNIANQTADSLMKSLQGSGWSSFLSSFGQASFGTQTTSRLLREGYKASSVVAACFSQYQVTFPEPLKTVWTKTKNPKDSKELRDTPLNTLLDKPNPYMLRSEYERAKVTCILSGGNCYGWKMRNGLGVTEEIYPFSDLNFTPISTEENYIDHYQFTNSKGQRFKVPVEDIVHYKWIAYDPECPQKGISPLLQAYREIDSSVQAIRVLYAVLKNNAMPGAALLLDDAGTSKSYEDDAAYRAGRIDKTTAQMMKADWKASYGNDQNGSMGIFRGVKDIKMFTPDFKSLDLHNISREVQSSICAAFKTSAIELGLSAGLENSTHDNLEHSSYLFTNRILIPLWKYNEEIETEQIAQEFGDYIVRYAVNEVGAVLQRRMQLMASPRTQGLLSTFMTLYTSGQITREMALAAAIYSMGFNDQEANELFPDGIQLVVNPKGQLENATNP
jgi:hypothetical protein